MQNEWQSFLQQQSANINDKLVTDFGDPLAEQAHALKDNVIADLSRLDVLEISGKDATEFLHGQLTGDVSALDANALQANAWCNIKGRVIVSFLLYRNDDRYYLLLENDMTGLVIKRLQMFILRSDVSIDNRSDELLRIGIRGESVHTALQGYIDTIAADTTVNILPVQDSTPRSIILLPLEQARTLWQKLTEQAVPVGSSAWSLCDIQTGIAWIGKKGSEEFLPQSLDLDLTGGLSFDKGCYPGQEIIARMHFRGKLKQRLFLAEVSISALPEIKTKLYVSAAKQHVGMVVNAAMRTEAYCLLLITLELKYFDKETVYLGTENGPVLTFLPLPYNIDV